MEMEAEFFKHKKLDFKKTTKYHKTPEKNCESWQELHPLRGS